MCDAPWELPGGLGGEKGACLLLHSYHWDSIICLKISIITSNNLACSEGTFALWKEVCLCHWGKAFFSEPRGGGLELERWPGELDGVRSKVEGQPQRTFFHTKVCGLQDPMFCWCARPFAVFAHTTDPDPRPAT